MHTEKSSFQSFRHLLPTVLLLASVFFFNFIARIILSPLLPTVETELGLNHSQSGALFLWIAAGYFVSLTASGGISARFTHRSIVVFAATAIGISLIGASFSTNLFTLTIGLTAIGLTAGPYLPSGLAMLTDLVNRRHWGKAIGIHELAPNIAFILAPILAEAGLMWLSWRGVLRIAGGASLLMGLMVFKFARGGQFTGIKPDLAALKKIRSNPDFWSMIALFSLGISSTLGIYAMLPLYLVTGHGMDQGMANTWFGLSRVSTPFMALLGGLAADRIGPSRTMAAVLGLTGISTIALGMAPSGWVVPLMFIQPILAVCFFPAGFATLSAIAPAESRNLVVSFTVPLGFVIGGGAVPMFIGAMGDRGALGLGITVVGGLIMTGALIAPAIGRKP